MHTRRCVMNSTDEKKIRYKSMKNKVKKAMREKAEGALTVLKKLPKLDA